jgi:hypothetical protein
MDTPRPRLFTIDVDGKPTVVFPASAWREAQELGREEWFKADLSLQMSHGAPLANAASKLRPRLASLDEVAAFEQHQGGVDRDSGRSGTGLSRCDRRGGREERMSEPFALSIFTIEADRKPIMTFAAKKHQDAEAFFSDERIRAKLQSATSGGSPVIDNRSILRVRMANAVERARYHERTAGIATPGVVFLVDLDAE